MYVCFGFSLARSRRAKTIHLQCQSLSLCRAFLLCKRALTILLLCRRAFCFATPELTVERYAIRWPALSRNSYESRRENRHENRCKIGPGSGSGHPKSTQNRSREPLGTPRGHQERPDGVSGASRERLGASSARPGSVRRLSKGAPECQKGRPGASGSAPRRPKSTPSPVRE